jgi:hypothetical protein
MHDIRGHSDWGGCAYVRVAWGVGWRAALSLLIDTETPLLGLVSLSLGGG